MRGQFNGSQSAPIYVRVEGEGTCGPAGIATKTTVVWRLLLLLHPWNSCQRLPNVLPFIPVIVTSLLLGVDQPFCLDRSGGSRFIPTSALRSR